MTATFLFHLINLIRHVISSGTITKFMDSNLRFNELSVVGIEEEVSVRKSETEIIQKIWNMLRHNFSFQISTND